MAGYSEQQFWENSADYNAYNINQTQTLGKFSAAAALASNLMVVLFMSRFSVI